MAQAPSLFDSEHEIRLVKLLTVFKNAIPKASSVRPSHSREFQQQVDEEPNLENVEDVGELMKKVDIAGSSHQDPTAAKSKINLAMSMKELWEDLHPHLNEIDWKSIANKMPPFTAEELTQHFIHELNPDTRQGDFTHEEGVLVEELANKKTSQNEDITTNFEELSKEVAGLLGPKVPEGAPLKRTKANMEHYYTKHLDPRSHIFKWSKSERKEVKMLSCKPPAVPTDTSGKRFKPRYSPPLPGPLSSEKPLPLPVIVSAAYDPEYVYVQVEDEKDDYEKMLSDLQKDLQEANEDYSASPVAGNAYAYASGDGKEWCRVLLEARSDGQQQLFNVDTGHRLMYFSSMELHVLPEKYFVLPAQALRCELRGVYPPGGLTGREGAQRRRKFSLNIADFQLQLEKKPAVIFVERWTPGEVGRPIRSISAEELSASVILYLDEDRRSVNVWVRQKLMGSLPDEPLEKRQHQPIREQIKETRRVPVSSSSFKAASSRLGSLRQDLAGQSSGAPSVTPSYDEERGEKTFGAQDHESAAVLSIACRPLLIHESEESTALDSALSVGVSSASTDIQHQLSESIEAPPCSEESSAEVIEDHKPLEFLNSFQPEAEKVKEIVAVRGTQPSDADVTIPVSLIRVDSPDAIYVRTKEDDALFFQLQEDMQRNFGPNVTNFEVGYKCAVYLDNKWWRAEVVDTECRPDCVVSLLDKGYQETVKADAIYELPPDFEQQPRLALRCKLFGVRPPSGTGWDATVSDYITSRLDSAESITICYREPSPKNRTDQPNSVVMMYVYDVEGGPLEIPVKTSINLNEELIVDRMANDISLTAASRHLGARPRVAALTSSSKMKMPKERPVPLTPSSRLAAPPKPKTKKTAKRLGRRPLEIPPSKEYEKVKAQAAPLTHLKSGRKRTLCLPRDARRDASTIFAINRMVGFNYDGEKIPPPLDSLKDLEEASTVRAELLKEVLSMSLDQQKQIADGISQPDPPLDDVDPCEPPHNRKMPPNAQTLAGARGLLMSKSWLEAIVAGDGEENGVLVADQGDPEADRTLNSSLFGMYAFAMALSKESPPIVGDPGDEEPEVEPEGSSASDGEPEEDPQI